ncbi:MAG: hydantoinase/oxoprolinase family protein [Alphaproteobacteria bacterium]|nr:hydantoinase/oxoprolinase family protein [Alphaproteobacteria bacterium]
MRRSKAQPTYALGVDIGGTFTDLVLLEQRTGALMAGKVLTNYTDLAVGVLRGVADLLARHGVAGAAVTKIVHGTTLATNALIERRGARTALIVTRGFRDLLEMARESRYDIFDIDLEIPQPLVPRRLVFEVTERLDASGAVVEKLALGEIAGIADAVNAEGVRSVAICLLHSFRNPGHELAVAKELNRIAPDITISLSSDVMPDLREYERASTTVANAYVQPVMRSYLDRLAGGLATAGIPGELMLIGSDAGTINRAAALRYPVRLVESGPAGGALAASFLGARAGVTDLIAFDMGGTTAKVCVIDGGEPERSDQFEVARVHRFARGSGLPLKVPVIEMIEIGAGGGSIAGMDELGLLRVGPESAAAAPGPACYGLGGERPTVSDADLYLGYLDADFFLGGAMKLDRRRASDAIQRHVAEPLGLSLTRAAWGIHAVVNDNMARAAKVHCLERGKDPRDYVLFAYGGAGPVHAGRVAAALGIRRVMFPQRAGVISALGFLAAPTAFERMRADICLLDAVDPDRSNRILDQLVAESGELVRAAGVPPKQCRVRREAALRFAGQSYAMPVTLPAGRVTRASLKRLHDHFIRAYRARYHRLNPDVPVELVSWRACVTGPRPTLTIAPPGQTMLAARKGTRPVYFPEAGRFVKCPVYDRFALKPGGKLRGPAVIEEPESTVVIGPGTSASIDRDGNLMAVLPAMRGVVGLQVAA